MTTKVKVLEEKITTLTQTVVEWQEECVRLTKMVNKLKLDLANTQARNEALQKLVLSYQRDNEVDYDMLNIDCGKEGK
jgi:predicted  nucleic acid-binding Zn-ribbon protein